MKDLISISFFLCVGLSCGKVRLPFEDESTDFFTNDETKKDNKLLMFADINLDKREDIVSWYQEDRTVQVIFGRQENEDASSSHLFYWNETEKLLSSASGDFDGDLASDLLLAFEADHNLRKVQICYGKGSTVHFQDCYVLTDLAVDDPVLLDYNADMKPDLLLETASEWLLHLSTITRHNFTLLTVPKKGGGLLYPHSSGYVDLNHDLSADIALTTNKGLLILLNKNGAYEDFTEDCILPWPAEADTVGKVSFSDYNSDAYMDIIVSSTKDKQTTLYIYSGTELNSALSGQCSSLNKNGWKVLSIGLKGWYFSDEVDKWLHTADVDNDGFPDILTILQNSQTGDRWPYILHNTRCNETCTWDRTFTVSWSWLPVSYNVTQAAFYDAYHDGLLDVILNTEHDSHTELHVMMNYLAKESCFISIKVASGLCPGGDKSNCEKPYVNSYGATIQYNSTNPDGSDALGIKTQLTQTANTALQLSYVQFGLGTTPNFVDSLNVGITQSLGQKKWTQKWETIVPNSQLVVIPHPPDKPSQWSMHLYVTPSHLVLITGAVVIGICGFISIIIAILHLKERHEDKKLRLQESQKFNFNAM